MSTTVTPQWEVKCDGCSYFRRYTDEALAVDAARMHEPVCPGNAPRYNARPGHPSMTRKP
jgi:hypothetical protein